MNLRDFGQSRTEVANFVIASIVFADNLRQTKIYFKLAIFLNIVVFTHLYSLIKLQFNTFKIS